MFYLVVCLREEHASFERGLSLSRASTGHQDGLTEKFDLRVSDMWEGMEYAARVKTWDP